MRMKSTILIVIIAALAAGAGCARKPPKAFKVNEPRLALPALDTTDLATALAILPERISGRCPAGKGRWELAIDRKISMRSTTLAKTDIVSVVGLTLKIAESTASGDGQATPIIVEGVSASVTATQNQDEAGRVVRQGYEGLSFQLVTGPGVPTVVNGDRSVPADLQDALWATLPVLPAPGTMQAGKWDITREREILLPGGVRAVDSITGSAIVSGISDGDAVVVIDWKSRLTGASTSDGVLGRITGGGGIGKAVCRFDGAGLKSCEAYESRTQSVSLSPPGGKRKLLEQKVSVESRLVRQQ